MDVSILSKPLGSPERLNLANKFVGLHTLPGNAMVI